MKLSTMFVIRVIILPIECGEPLAFVVS